MKKLILVLAIVFFAFSAYAIDWSKVDSKQVAWDTPTTYPDGTPIDPLQVQNWTFYVYTKDVSGANIRAEGSVVDTTAATVTIASGEKKLIGVSASYTDIDGIVVDESIVAWSDDPVDCEGGVTFGLHNLKSANKPGGLRRQ